MNALDLVVELDSLRVSINKVILIVNPDHVEEARLIDGRVYHIIQDFSVNTALYKGTGVITIESKKSNLSNENQ
jgi:hypothetical protein